MPAFKDELWKDSSMLINVRFLPQKGNFQVFSPLWKMWKLAISEIYCGGSDGC